MPYRRAAVVLICAAVFGCAPTKPPDPAKSNYADLGPKQVPDFLRNTVWQQTDLQNASPLRVSGYGLVVNLDGTGDTHAPNPVHEYMQKQLQTHGFGSSTNGLQDVSPEQVLNNATKRAAIVHVDGFIPPGAHKGQSFDVSVSALENSNTTSLNHGELYQTDLAPRGGDPFNPGGSVINPWAQVSGPIAINPSYAMDSATPSQNQKLSMRYGVVMNGGVIAEDRPLILKLRQPERRVARQIESRVNERFQDANDERFAAVSGFKGSRTAVAKDEGEVWIYVPETYRGDWERFIGVVMHLYSNPNADFATLQAKNLATLAAKDGDQAPLLDISYCWEALGEPAIPACRTLYNSPVPAVAYAAARAGAYLGDYGGQQMLATIAQTANHPFQINAVQTLGELPSTAQLRTVLRDLLDSDQLLVRIEAYKAMVATEDPIVLSKKIGDRFTLDILESDGPPVIYATRVGEPRIALIGRPAQVVAPSLLMAMDDRLSILGDKDRHSAQVYYRGNKYNNAVSVECLPDLPLVVARLGGENAPGEERLRFPYTDVVGILQKMSDQHMIASRYGGTKTPAVFQIQSLPGLDDPILAAPSIPEQRPADVPTTQVTAAALPR